MSSPIEETLTMPTPSFTKPSPSTSTEPILIRRAHLYEGHHIARLAVRAYWDYTLIKFLSPHRAQYPTHFQRGYSHRATARMLDTRNLTLFAYEKSKPNYPIGQVQCIRLGSDAAARKLDTITWRILYFILGYLFSAWSKAIVWLAGGDKSGDPVAVSHFLKEIQKEEKEHWTDHPERANRWHAQSVVVDPDFQGRGVGKKLMAEVIGRAESESVIMGVEASAAGERMYEKVGFELLARFGEQNPTEREFGGVMIRYPRGWKGKRHDSTG